MADRYEPSSFESAWREKWRQADLFRTQEDASKPKFYGLVFFPYPSGAGLSVGHCRNYIPTDVLCRLKVMQGHNVLFPMGFDAFGLPAENEAIKRQRNPDAMVREYGATYRRQMELVGTSFDWNKELYSCDPSYYKWTQWIFKKLYEKGLAYRRNAEVNWDPIDKTVLANEEVIAGRAERSGALVEKKLIPQWFFKITEYAQRLLDDLDELDWPEGIKQQQRNWIGRSEGVEFEMAIVVPEPGSDVAGSAERTRAAAAGLDPVVKARMDAIANLAESVTRTIEQTTGVNIDLEPKAPVSRHKFRVFTTRIDTIFGMTFCVMAPEHPLVEQIKLLVDEPHAQAMDAYQEHAKSFDEATRQNAEREKTGCFTGAYAVNPANGANVPIYLADYVLMGYGTGAIMAVPGHDQRDFDFAQKFGIEIKPVIAPMLGEGSDDLSNQDGKILSRTVEALRAQNKAFETKDGILINSGEYSYLTVSEAQRVLGEWMEGLEIGERKVNYKLRDWLISRQRYWGCPIPVIHTQDGEEHLVLDSLLPVTLPAVENYAPSDDGSSPLSRIHDWVNIADNDGRPARRETDTMGGFACSSWYFLRFLDPENFEEAWNKQKADYWMPVDCYVGGAEHAVMHLLYARFWTKVFYDLGLVSCKEPFQRLENQGQVLGRTPYRKPKPGEKLSIEEQNDGILISFEEAAQLPEDEVTWRWARMSKSKGNVVTPDEAVEQYGADALRVYELFVAPFDAEIQWSNEGMQGAVRFLHRVFKFVSDVAPNYVFEWTHEIQELELSPAARKIRQLTHQLIKKASEDIEKFAFNTYISAMMIFLNEVAEVLKTNPEGRDVQLALSEAAESLVLVLAPAAPHSADELWTNELKREGFTYRANWPRFDAKLAQASEVTIAVQVNGKLRDTFEAAAGADQATLEATTKGLPKIAALLEGKTIRKVIVVPGKLVNIVASD